MLFYCQIMDIILLYLIFFIVFHRLNYHQYELYDNLYNFVFLLISIIYFDILKYFYQSMKYIMVIAFNMNLFYIIYHNDNIMLKYSQDYLVINLMNKRNRLNLYFMVLLF